MVYHPYWLLFVRVGGGFNPGSNGSMINAFHRGKVSNTVSNLVLAPDIQALKKGGQGAPVLQQPPPPYSHDQHQPGATWTQSKSRLGGSIYFSDF